MNFEVICRLCLIETNSDTFLKSSISKDFQELFSLDVLLDHNLPKRICQECLLTNNKFYEFTELVRSNQRKLTELRKSLNENCEDNKPETVIKEEESEDDNVILEDFCMKEEYLENDIDLKHDLQPKKRMKKKKVSPKLKKHKVTSEKNNQDGGHDTDLDDEQDSVEDKRIREFFDLTCSKCSTTFDKFISWKNHVRTKHGEENPGMFCCNKKLHRRHQLLTHIALHKNPTEFSCPDCSKQYKSKHRLKEHIDIYHNGNTDRFHCEHCPRKFSTKSYLKQHQLNHISDAEKERLKAENTCPDCGYGFLSRAKMLHHIRFQHAMAYSTVCSACGKTFKSKYNFFIHYQNTHGDGVGRPQCSICGMILADDSSLRRHMRNRHNNTGDYTCSVCSKKCPSQNALKAHVEYVHSKERKFSCQYCDKSFKRPIGLKEHLTTHVGGALYQCTFCEKTFNSGANMYSHRKRVHPNELKALKEQDGKCKIDTM